MHVEHAGVVFPEVFHRVGASAEVVTYVKAQRGLWEKGKNHAIDKFGFKDKKAEFTPSEELPVVVCVGKKLKAPATWDDEKGRVTTDYQDHLEKEWIARLREKYPVVINGEVWEKIRK